MDVPQKRIDFLDWELGVFFHFGIRTFYEGHQDWDMKPMDPSAFDPKELDCEQWIRSAKEAGAAYAILVCKHHDGFANWPSKYTDYSVAATPWKDGKGDVVREFVDACRKYDIIPFFYHTTLDWYKEEFETDFDAYLQYLNDSVEILCKNYGKVGGLWFDGNWSKKTVDWKEGELYGLIRKYQPEAIIINNTGLSARGKTGHPEIDAVTYENGLAAPPSREGMAKYISGEMNHTINDHWGYGQNDLNYKSPAQIIESMCNSRKIGANYLMNIGPEGQGKINSYQKELLKLMGRWMNVFGEAIYNGRPYASTPDGRSFILKSVNGDCLYLFIFDLGIEGDGNVTVKGKRLGNFSFGNVKDKVSSVEWMDNGEKLTFIQGNDLLCVNATGYPYGTSYAVRVAKAIIEK